MEPAPTSNPHSIPEEREPYAQNPHHFQPDSHQQLDHNQAVFPNPFSQPAAYHIEPGSLAFPPTATDHELTTPTGFLQTTSSGSSGEDEALRQVDPFQEDFAPLDRFCNNSFVAEHIDADGMGSDVMLPRLDRKESLSSFERTYGNPCSTSTIYFYGIRRDSQQEVPPRCLPYEEGLYTHSTDAVEFYGGWVADSLSDIYGSKGILKSSEVLEHRIHQAPYSSSDMQEPSLQPDSLASTQPGTPVSHDSTPADTESDTPTCTNCLTRVTSLWRRNMEGAPLCNACSLYLRLHGTDRPKSLKTDIVKKRNRGSASEASATGKSVLSRRATKKYGYAGENDGD